MDDLNPIVVDPRNGLNDLGATEWVARTVSVLTQKGLGKGSEEAKFEKLHPAPFSFQDVSRFIEFFTKADHIVLDPFAGVGSTLKASALLGRRSLGFELNPNFCNLARERLEVEVGPMVLSSVRTEIYNGDARELIPGMADNSIHFVITSPPYWGILNKIDHKANQERVAKGLTHNYGEDPKDLALIASYKEFVCELASLFHSLTPKVMDARYMVVIVGDFRDKAKYHMFHADLAQAIEALGGFSLKGITILYQKFKRVFPYGYPYAFVPNLHHQYALIFRKEKQS